MSTTGIRIEYRGVISESSILWSFSLPAVLSTSMTLPSTWVANTLLVNKRGGYYELGIFNAANQFRMALLFVPTLLGQVIVPILASMRQPTTRTAKRVLVVATLINGAITLPAVLVLVPCSNWVMSFYGPTFASRGAVLQVAVLSAALLAIQTPVRQSHHGFGKDVGRILHECRLGCFSHSGRSATGR